MSQKGFNGRDSYLFTSESVSEGHPDKIADQISDAILDLYLSKDPYARVACESMVSTNRVMLLGEIRSADGTNIDLEQIEHKVRDVIRRIGYEQDSFHWKNVVIQSYLHGQSPDIAIGVDSAAGKDEGAGDQGIMFGYACDETACFMPASLYYAHRILAEMARDRKSGKRKEFGPDAKSQVTLLYRNGIPVGVDSVVVSTQHHPDLHQNEVRELVRAYVVDVFFQKGWMCDEEKLYVNPTGRFVVGGPDGDAGLTGRKIIVDTYGGAAPHGGGAFSGKDPTKVDRSAAYAARYLAKNVVAAGLAKRCTIQVAYAIGISEPLALYVDLHGTGIVDNHSVEKALFQVMDLSPRGIREHLSLNRPIYERTASYGHFGYNPEEDGGYSWERLDLVDKIRKIL